MSRTTLTEAPVGLSTWTIDASHSEMGFAVRHLMISTSRGRFNGFSGTVTVADGDFATADVELTIDPSTVDTRDPQRDAHLRSADFFDVEKFPALTFKSRRVEALGDGLYTLTGDLTIRGVTRQVVLDVVSQGMGRDPWGGERAGFTARGTVDRRDFGLVWNQALDAGGVVLGDQVKLVLEVELIRQAPQAA